MNRTTLPLLFLSAFAILIGLVACKPSEPMPADAISLKVTGMT